MARSEARTGIIAPFLEAMNRKAGAIEYVRDRFPGIFETPNSIRTFLVEASSIKDLDVEPLEEPNFARILLIDGNVEMSLMANKPNHGESRARLDFTNTIGRATKLTASVFTFGSDNSTVEVGFYHSGHFSRIFYYPETRMLDVRGNDYEDRFDGFKGRGVTLPFESPFIRSVVNTNDLLIVSHSFPEKFNSGVFIMPTSLFIPENR